MCLQVYYNELNGHIQDKDFNIMSVCASVCSNDNHLLFVMIFQFGTETFDFVVQGHNLM